MATMLMGKERGDSRRFYVSLSKARENKERTHVSVVGPTPPHSDTKAESEPEEGGGTVC